MAKEGFTQLACLPDVWYSAGPLSWDDSLANCLALNCELAVFNQEDAAEVDCMFTVKQ